MNGILEFFAVVLLGLAFIVAIIVGGIFVRRLSKWLLYPLIGIAYILIFVSHELDPQDYVGLSAFLVRVIDFIAIPLFILAGCCITFLMFGKKEKT